MKDILEKYSTLHKELKIDDDLNLVLKPIFSIPKDKIIQKIYIDVLKKCNLLDYFEYTPFDYSYLNWKITVKKGSDISNYMINIFEHVEDYFLNEYSNSSDYTQVIKNLTNTHYKKFKKLYVKDSTKENKFESIKNEYDNLIVSYIRKDKRVYQNFLRKLPEVFSQFMIELSKHFAKQKDIEINSLTVSNIQSIIIDFKENFSLDIHEREFYEVYLKLQELVGLKISYENFVIELKNYYIQNKQEILEKKILFFCVKIPTKYFELSFKLYFSVAPIETGESLRFKTSHFTVTSSYDTITKESVLKVFNGI